MKGPTFASPYNHPAERRWPLSYAGARLLLQVQKLALRSFIQRDWQLPGTLARVPLEFVTEVLLPALAKEQHYPKATSGLVNAGTAPPAGTVTSNMDVAVRHPGHAFTYHSPHTP